MTRKTIFGATNFLTKNAPKFLPKFLSLYFVGPKKSRKTPAKLPTIRLSQKSHKIHRRASAGAQGEDLYLILKTHQTHQHTQNSKLTKSIYKDQYDRMTGGPYDGNEGRKHRIIHRMHPLHSPCFMLVFNKAGNEVFRLPGRRGIATVVQ